MASNKSSFVRAMLKPGAVKQLYEVTDDWMEEYKERKNVSGPSEKLVLEALKELNIRVTKTFGFHLEYCGKKQRDVLEGQMARAKPPVVVGLGSSSPLPQRKNMAVNVGSCPKQRQTLHQFLQDGIQQSDCCKTVINLALLIGATHPSEEVFQATLAGNYGPLQEHALGLAELDRQPQCVDHAEDECVTQVNGAPAQGADRLVLMYLWAICILGDIDIHLIPIGRQATESLYDFVPNFLTMDYGLVDKDHPLELKKEVKDLIGDYIRSECVTGHGVRWGDMAFKRDSPAALKLIQSLRAIAKTALANVYGESPEEMEQRLDQRDFDGIVAQFMKRCYGGEYSFADMTPEQRAENGRKAFLSFANDHELAQGLSDAEKISAAATQIALLSHANRDSSNLPFASLTLEQRADNGRKAFLSFANDHGIAEGLSDDEKISAGARCISQMYLNQIQERIAAGDETAMQELSARGIRGGNSCRVINKATVTAKLDARKDELPEMSGLGLKILYAMAQKMSKSSQNPAWVEKGLSGAQVLDLAVELAVENSLMVTQLVDSYYCGKIFEPLRCRVSPWIAGVPGDTAPRAAAEKKVLKLLTEKFDGDHVSAFSILMMDVNHAAELAGFKKGDAQADPLEAADEAFEYLISNQDVFDAQIAKVSTQLRSLLQRERVRLNPAAVAERNRKRREKASSDRITGSSSRQISRRQKTHSGNMEVEASSGDDDDDMSFDDDDIPYDDHISEAEDDYDGGDSEGSSDYSDSEDDDDDDYSDSEDSDDADNDADNEEAAFIEHDDMEIQPEEDGEDFNAEEECVDVVPCQKCQAGFPGLNPFLVCDSCNSCGHLHTLYTFSHRSQAPKGLQICPLCEEWKSMGCPSDWFDHDE